MRPALLILLGGALFALRLAISPGHVDSMDGVYFVRGVERYSLAESRPHWPGYPVYIGAGKLLCLAGLSAPTALHVLSAAGWTACLFLIAALAGTGRPRAEVLPAGVAAASVWGLAPVAWFGGEQILSDVPALALALGTWWLASRPDGGPRATVAGALLAGMTAGARLPYVALLAPWLVAQATRVRRASSRARVAWIAAVLVPLASSVAVWLLWQIARDPAYLDLAAGRIQAHLGNWHHRVLAQPGVRLGDLARTFVLHGAGGWLPGAPLLRLPLTLLLAAAAVRGLRALARAPRVAGLLALWTLPYLLLVLTANDPRLARYTLPLTAAVAVTAGIGIAGRWTSAAIVAAGVTAIVPLDRLARTQPPLPVQVVSYVSATLDPSRDVLLISDDSAPLRPFLEEAGWPVEAVGEERLLERAERLSREGRRVYATSPSMHAPERWRLEARFRRDRLLESRPPREIALFRYEAPGT